MKLNTLEDIEILKSDRKIQVFRVDHIMPYTMEEDIKEIVKMRKSTLEKRLFAEDYEYNDFEVGPCVDIRTLVFLAPKEPIANICDLNYFGKALSIHLKNKYSFEKAKEQSRKTGLEPPIQVLGLPSPPYFRPGELLNYQRLVSFRVPVPLVKKTINCSHRSSIFIFPSVPPSSIAFKKNYTKIVQSESDSFDLVKWYKGEFYGEIY